MKYLIQLNNKVIKIEIDSSHSLGTWFINYIKKGLRHDFTEWTLKGKQSGKNVWTWKRLNWLQEFIIKKIS